MIPKVKLELLMKGNSKEDAKGLYYIKQDMDQPVFPKNLGVQTLKEAGDSLSNKFRGPPR